MSIRFFTNQFRKQHFAIIAQNPPGKREGFVLYFDESALFAMRSTAVVTMASPRIL